MAYYLNRGGGLSFILGQRTIAEHGMTEHLTVTES
jgi:hypothetical protein